MEWEYFSFEGFDCYIRFQDGVGWISKVEKELKESFITVQSRFPASDEIQARKKCEQAATALLELA